MSEIESLLPPLQQMKPVKEKSSDRKEWNKILKSQRSLDATYVQMSISKQRSVRSYSLQEDSITSNSKCRRNSIPVGVPEVTLQPSSKNISLSVKSCSLNQTYTLLSPTTLFGDQKLILRGCQILETLSKMLRKDVAVTSDCECPEQSVSSCHIKLCSYYHDKLKSLLKEQCLINLRKECIAHIQTAELFVSEVKEIVFKEYNKLKHVLETKKNSAVYETGAYLASVRTLIEDLRSHSNLWPSLLTSVSRAHDILHIGWNPTIESLLVQTHRILQKLELHALYWVRRVLDIDFTIMCLSSAHSASSEDLQNMFQTFYNFNKLLQFDTKDTDGDYHLCHLHSYKRNSYCAICQTKPFSFSLAIELLASWEAKVSAKKLSYFLTSECDKLSVGKQEHFKWISIVPDSEKISNPKVNDTSDYCSASYSDIACKTNNATFNATMHSAIGDGPDLSGVLNSVIQNSQTLLLKFLFAIACVKIQPDKLSPLVTTKNTHEVQASRQKWKIAKQRTSVENGTMLEHVYWHCFWQYIGEEIVFSLTNLSPPVSSLQNDSLLPLSFSSTEFQKAVLNLLQNFKPDNDISSKSKAVTDMVYNMLYTHICLMTWDERFCAALASSQLSRCIPIPLVEGAAGTNQGNLLCGTFEPLISSLLTLIPAKYHIKAQQVAVLLNCTTDFALRWGKEKRLSFLSSWNMSLYLLISCSDLELIAKCLHNLNSVSWEEFSDDDMGGNNQLKLMWQEIYEQISFLKNIGSHIYTEINQKAYKISIETFDQVMPPRSYWRKLRIGNKDNSYIQESVRAVLDTSMQTLSHLSLNHQLVVGTALMEGFACAWLDYIWNKKIRFSHSGGMQLCKDIDYVIDWLDHFPLAPEVKHKLLMVDHMRKLNRVAHVLSTSHPRLRRLSLSRNKIAPSIATGGKDPLNTRFNKKRFDAEPNNDNVDTEQWNNLVVTDHYALNGCICCFL